MTRYCSILLIVALVGCGDASPPPSQPGPHVLAWTPPVTFTDNSTLDPRDLLEYWIYAFDNEVSDNLLPCAVVVAIDNEGRCITNFDLWGLAPFGIRPPVRIAMKAISTDNQASPFATPVTWEE